MPRGSREVEFFRATDATPGTSVSIGDYLLETTTPSRPSTITERRGKKNEAKDWAASVDFDSVSGTAQIATEASDRLQRFDFFITEFDADIGDEKWVITEVSAPEGQADAKKQTFTARKDYSYTPA